MKSTNTETSLFPRASVEFVRASRRRVEATLLTPFALLAVACAPNPTPSNAPPSSTTVATPEPTAPPVATPPPPILTPPPTSSGPRPETPPAGGVAGRWISPSCGARKYERRFTFADDGTFEALDLVSPCPKGMACVWSGIVTSKGTWKMAGDQIRLAVTAPGTGPGSAGLPATLALDPATHAPVERAGSTTCVYRR